MMNRRKFLAGVAYGTVASSLQPLGSRRTQHLIFIVNGGGVRKQEYYENEALSPNMARLAREGFVFEQDHCERVASHEAACMELLEGREWQEGSRYPTILDYVGSGRTVNSLDEIPAAMNYNRPRILLCRHMVHDVGHQSYGAYLDAVRNTDAALGRVLQWLDGHAYFSGRTAIVIRPEFGRDGEVNSDGHLHHSYGFESTHRVASIFRGPDFRRGVDRKTVVRSVDMTPTLASLFNVEAGYASGRILPVFTGLAS
jgi:arylsulfatase A-like enzyme